MRVKSVSYKKAGPSRLFCGLDDIQAISDRGSHFG